MYVELHAHSAYSFLDGASQPEELAARAAELGYEALALTDHDGVFGSLEFAHAAKAFGLRAITGAEITLQGGAHVTLLVETPQGLREPLPAADRGPRRHAAEGGGGPAAAGVASPGNARAERRARLPVRLRTPRPRRVPAERCRPRRRRLRPRALLRRAPAAVRARRRAPATPACASSPATSASRQLRPATSMRTIRAAPRSRTRSSRSAVAPRSTAASRNGAATTRPCCSRRTRCSIAFRTTTTPSTAPRSLPPAWRST